MKIRNIFTAAALAVVIAAGSARAAEPAAPATLFEYPSVPDKLTKPAMRANFMVEHLWDKCDLEKTAVTDLAAFHNTFTDYLSFFALADKAVVEKSIKKYVERVAKNPTNLNLTVGMLHSDVLNLRSQYCSDEVYTMFADNIAAAKKVDKALKRKAAGTGGGARQLGGGRHRGRLPAAPVASRSGIALRAHRRHHNPLFQLRRMHRLLNLQSAPERKHSRLVAHQGGASAHCLRLWRRPRGSREQACHRARRLGSGMHRHRSLRPASASGGLRARQRQEDNHQICRHRQPAARHRERGAGKRQIKNN